MSDEPPIPPNPTIQPPPLYKPWVGVVLSVLISGLGLFAAGKKRQGAVWFILLFVLVLFWSWADGAAFVPVGVAPWVLSGVGFVLWVLMLWKSYRPVPRFRRSLWLLLGVLCVLLEVGVTAIAHQLVQPFKIPTGAMSPTLQGSRKDTDGSALPPDHLFVSRCAYWFGNPQRGDVLVFRTDGIDGMPKEQRGQFYVKRIVGLPGDRISFQDGRLMNNGKLVAEPTVFAQLKYGPLPNGMSQYLRREGEVFEVPTECYFVVGDNSANSYDSRSWGPVPAKNVFGRATKIYWPPDRAGRIE